ncbi:MAG: ABC transporter permease, partial [Bacteroidetes bacterium]|nr:ABC transporter permease [Bacteroidota bacterium]
AINSIWISPGQTSVPYKGMQSGRYIRFTNDDHDEIERTILGVEHITSRFSMWGGNTVSYKNEYGTFNIRSVHPAHKYLENTIVTSGRFINDIDLEQFRKVVSIGKLVKEALFKDNEEEPIGKYIKVNGVPFKIIGTYEDVGGEGEMNYIYLPITTAQRVFNGQKRVNRIMFTTGNASVATTTKMSEQVRELLAGRHHFDVEDSKATYVRNNNENFETVTTVFRWINFFVWTIGIGTVIAGIVGVSNIMLIVVKERTKEIGIRKAIGATPASIVSQILMESVFITALFGYIGLVLGVGLLSTLANVIPENEVFFEPTVDIRIGIIATILLVIAGSIAGFLPARRASTIRPIEALREE